MLSNKSVYKQVSIFNEALMNKFSNYTPNKLVAFDDRNSHWMNDFVKCKIKWENQISKIYTKSGYSCNDYLRLKKTTVLVSKVAAKRKEDYNIIIASMLNNLKLVPKHSGQL